MAKSNIKTERKTITIPSGTTASPVSKTIELSNNFDRCVGMLLVEIKDGGIPYYDISLKDRDAVYIDPQHKQVLESGTNQKPDDRFLTVDIPIIGNTSKFEFVTHITETLTTDLVYQLIFLLKNDCKNEQHRA